MDKLVVVDNLVVARDNVSGFLVMPVSVIVMSGLMMISCLVVDGLVSVMHCAMMVIIVLVMDSGKQ